MKEYLKKYVMLRRHNMSVAWKKAKRSKMCYVFLAPYAILFSLFVILPVISSIFFSFTYYNILEKPRFIGLSNYISLILEDDIFLIGIKNTLLIAVITGPLGYIMSFLFAWLINELPRWVRSVAVVVFYAPSIAGNCYVIFSVFFRGDAYGYVNAFLMKLGIIDSPILWFINPKYMLPICMLVILWMSLGTGFLSFVAGLQGVDRAQFEAGYMDGIRNRWQELWYITLPNMKLDINHEGEIVSAVSRAFLNDQLIYAFKETLHNTVYVAKEQIYAEDNVKELIAQLQRVTQDAAYMEQELDVQKAGALAETEEHFKEIIENTELLW